VKRKLKDIGPGEQYQRCDPFKIEEILSKVSSLKESNDFMRASMHQVGTTVNQLAQKNLDLKAEAYYDSSLDPHLQDMNACISQLNQLFNDVHFKVLQSDDQLGQVQVSCTNTLSSQGFLKKYDDLEKQFDNLEMQHTQIKHHLFQQTTEYKSLQADFELSKKLANTNKTESFKLRNLEKMLEEVRTDNGKLADRIAEHQQTIFSKERDIDKLKH